MNLDDHDLVPWTAAQLAEVERAVGALPDDYRDFVLTTGSGDIPLHQIPDTDAIADKILDAADILGRGGGFDGWIPAQYIPVLRGNGGSLAIKLADGTVHLADYDLGAELGLDDDPSEEIMTSYATSWTVAVDQMATWPLI